MEIIVLHVGLEVSFSTWLLFVLFELLDLPLRATNVVQDVYS